MKNLSFWNKLAGAKGMAAACTATAALSAVLLFVVCAKQNSDPCATNPYAAGCSQQGSDQFCRHEANPSICSQLDASNPDDATTCQSMGGAVVSGCGVAITQQECAKYPNAAGCGSVGPVDPCQANPSLPQCSSTNQFCRYEANPGICSQLDASNPTDASTCQSMGGVVVSACNVPITQPECNNFPNAAGCGGGPVGPVDPCQANPSLPECGSGGTGKCANGPSLACCDSLPTFPGCVGECPSTTPGCPGWVDPCPSTQPGCPGYDVCLANGATEECCALRPTFQGCGGGGTGKFCRWDNDPSNCHEIGGPYSDTATATEASCKKNYGEVVSNCNEVSALEYCRWNDTCYAIVNPNDPSSNAGMTERENCAAYGQGGVFSSKDACEAYSGSSGGGGGGDWYCYWPTGCAKIANPDALKTDCTPGPCPDGMTNKGGCEAWGKLFESQAACQAYTPPTVGHYCDWGTGGCWFMNNEDGPCDSSGGPCTGTQMQHCTANGKVITCSGSDRPGEGECCAH